MFRLIILSLLLAVITYFNHAGGDKSKLREPSLIQLNMQLNHPPTIATPSSQDRSQITLQNGTLTLSTIEFLGSPENKTDFHFTTSLRKQYLLKPDQTHLSLLEFDVPAGRYRQAKIMLHANGKDSLPAMTVNALWHRKGNTQPVPLEIRFFDFPQVLSLKLDPEGKDRFLVFPNQGFSNVQITIHPLQLFDQHVMEQLQQKEMQDTDGLRKMIISEDHNASIHALLAANLHQSIRAVIKR